jgi:integrase
MTETAAAVASVEELFRLPPLKRFQTLLAGEAVPAWLRDEPIVFARDDPIYGYGCGIEGCQRHSTQSGLWCTDHAAERRAALRADTGEATWKAQAVPLAARAGDLPPTRGPACRLCPGRDAAGEGLCLRHRASYTRARKRAGADFDEAAWAARQHALPGLGDCQVPGCLGRVERFPGMCPRHRDAWRRAGSPRGPEFVDWLPQAAWGIPGVLVLAALPPLVATEIRYGLWAHTQDVTPARWHPMWLRTLERSCAAAGVTSIMELDPAQPGWTRQPAAVNRILRDLQRDVGAVHRTRDDTRAMGYIDTDYWGFRLAQRRSSFDLTTISQRWLRELTWDYLATLFDSGQRPRSPSPVEQIRRAVTYLSAYLAASTPDRGDSPDELSEATAREFLADLSRRVTEKRSMRCSTRGDTAPSVATPSIHALTLNGVRKVLRWALETGTAERIGLPREFIVAIPSGGVRTTKNPRPFSDPVLATLADPNNIRLLADRDPHDSGTADIWWIQLRCGRRIGEVINLRFDCVSEHLGRTWMWVDMTKVGKLDYAIQIPRDVYDLVRNRQAKTRQRFRDKLGTEPSAEQCRAIALFPSKVSNPTFERAVSVGTFQQAFRDWICSAEIDLPGHTTHQARHTLATRLFAAGASMVEVKKVLGQVSERMGEAYVLIAGSQVEPFLQQVWVTGPGNPTPGQVVLTPTEAERHAANQVQLDTAALPTEHGLCTLKPVVGGADCPFNRDCDNCEHFVITGADYTYWKRREQQWATLAEGAPTDESRDYLYDAFAPSSQAIAGLEKALVAAGLLEKAQQLDLRNPHQDFFEPIWRIGWRAGDLIQLGSPAADNEPHTDSDAGPDLKESA